MSFDFSGNEGRERGSKKGKQGFNIAGLLLHFGSSYLASILALITLILVARWYINKKIDEAAKEIKEVIKDIKPNFTKIANPFGQPSTEELTQKIQDLEAKKAATQAEVKSCGLIIESMKLEWKELAGTTYVTAHMKINNRSKHPIQHVRFDGIAKSKNRTIPWAEHDFGNSVDGGLEPGESVELEIGLFDSVWNRVPKDDPNVVFSATPIYIEGPNKQVIYRAKFTKKDQEELDRLKANLAEK